MAPILTVWTFRTEPSKVADTRPRMAVPVEVSAKHREPVPAHENELIQVLVAGKLGPGGKLKNVSHRRARSSWLCNVRIHHLPQG